VKEHDGTTNDAVLTLESVGKHYGEGTARVTALDGVSLAVRGGEMVAVMGTSGSGKSTLLSIAGGLLAPTSGKVVVCGESLIDASATRLARVSRVLVGFVFQDFNLISALTAVENVSLPLDLAGVSRSLARASALEALETVGLGGRVTSYPDELSGGERQRVAIARAVVGERRLLLADEPTGALDSVTGEAILRGLRERADAGAAVVVVTHDARHASWGDRIVYLRDGVVVDETVAVGPERLLAGEPA